MKSKKYALYFGKLSELPQNTRFFYYSGDTKRLLLYTEEKPKETFVLISKEDEETLTPDEKKWLFECKRTINNEHLKECEKDRVVILNSFMDVFEEELRKEVKKEELKE